MSAAQKWIVRVSGLALFLVVLFPPWRQTHKGQRLSYRGELGHHLLWPRPEPVGEQSWIVSAPASECEVSLELGAVFRQCGIVFAMTAILLFAFRTRPTT